METATTGPTIRPILFLVEPRSSETVREDEGTFASPETVGDGKGEDEGKLRSSALYQYGVCIQSHSVIG